MSCAKRTHSKPDRQSIFDFAFFYQTSSKRGLLSLLWPKSKSRATPWLHMFLYKQAPGKVVFLVEVLPFFGLGVKHQGTPGTDALKQHPAFLHSAAEIPGGPQFLRSLAAILHWHFAVEDRNPKLLGVSLHTC